MTVASEQIVRWLVIVVLGVATGTMFLISMRGNYLYGYGLGQSEEKRQLFAWANVAADVWKAFGLIAVTLLWRTRHRRIALIGSLAWLLCLLTGINSAIGVYVQDRTTATGAREARHASYLEAKRQLEQLEGRSRVLPPHRGIGQVEAALAATLKSPVVIDDKLRGTLAERSSNCSKIDARTAEGCARVAALTEELAIGQEAQVLDARLAILRRRVGELRDAGGAVAPDPLGEFYAWATRGLVSVRDVGFGFPLFFALLIEVVSAFGAITVARYAECSRPLAASPDTAETGPAMAGRDRLRPAPVLLVEQDGEPVVAWMAARASPSADAGAISIEELYEDYKNWCASNSVRSSSARAFTNAFDRLRDMPELAGKIRKFANRYYGITLAEPETAPPAMRQVRR